MPFAKNFAAMMDLPCVGDRLDGFAVESIEVRDASGYQGLHGYAVEMVLEGAGGHRRLERAMKGLFGAHPTTFSAYGNPYHLWCGKPEVEELGSEGPAAESGDGRRYRVRVVGAGAGMPLARELERFLAYLEANSQLASQEPSTREALARGYLGAYAAEVKRKIGRYRTRLRRSEAAQG